MISATHIHAMVIHFPIALLLVGFLSEITGLGFKKPFFNRAAFYLLLLGALGTIASYLAGNAAGDGMGIGFKRNLQRIVATYGDGIATV